jgi:serine protease AprX
LASPLHRPSVDLPGSSSQGSTLFKDSVWGNTAADAVSTNPSGVHLDTADPGSLYTIEKAIGARDVWQKKDSSGRQVTGKGVSVALLDTGTAAVPGLNSAGKVAYGPDLSLEGNGPLTQQDTYGHGTHLAGIIAAHDPVTLTSTNISTLDPKVQLGVAPDAGLVSLKLASTDGSVDVSQVIAALNWITENQIAPDGSRVRVVNLAFGTNSVQAYQRDPLAAAAENAWRKGLVVVVSGGNEGPTAGRLDDPAFDPYVLAVGASDSNNSPNWTNPIAASFSSSGTATRHVDLVAPGRSIVSMRAPGSFVDVNYPEGRVDGDTTGRLFRGSGTSQAAAVVSGAAALLLQAYPSLTPDMVKTALMRTATDMPDSAVRSGTGQLDVAAAFEAIRQSLNLQSWNSQDPDYGGQGGLNLLSLLTPQVYEHSTGQGSIDAARGDARLIDADGNPISGEIDVQGNAWDPATWWDAASSKTSWSGGKWLGDVWTGSGWQSTSSGTLSARWSSARWTSARWSSARWSDASWSSARWSSARWSSARWSSARWSSARWSAASSVVTSSSSKAEA